MKHNLRLFKIAELARENGFTTHTVTTKFTNDYLLGGKNAMINEVCILLWMCELQKWLREVHNIYVNSDYYQGYPEARFYYDVKMLSDDNYNGNQDGDNNIYTFEEAFELGLQEGLKLI